MSRIKIALFDLDGVFADLEGMVIETLRRKHRKVKIPHQSERRSFYLDEEIEEKHRHLVAKIIAKKGFFASLKPIPGTIEALHRISRIENVHTMICTSPLKKSIHCIDEKYEWVDRWIGSEFVPRTIMIRDKTLVDGVVLVDDSHEVRGAKDRPSWEHILHSQPHNLHLVNRPRVDLTNPLGYKWLYEWLMFE